MKSLGFSKFRSLIDTWDEFVFEEENKNNIKSIIDNNELVMFFKKNDEYFGLSEEGRITFAKIKDPDETQPEGWEEEANFTAHNLSKVIEGENSQSVFGHKDLKDIEIVDQEEIIEKLGDKAFKSNKKIEKIIIPTNKNKKDREEAPNFKRTDEE